MFYPLIGMPQGAEWLIILAIVILVFGAAKLPDLARGAGQSLRIFRDETKALREDDKKDGDKTDKPAELNASERERLAELDRREAEIKAERERLSGN